MGAFLNIVNFFGQDLNDKIYLDPSLMAGCIKLFVLKTIQVSGNRVYIPKLMKSHVTEVIVQN